MAKNMLIKFHLMEKSVGWLIVELNKNETTAIFADLLKATDGLATHHNNSISRNKLDIVNTYVGIVKCIEKINESTYDIKIETDIESEVTFEKLFDLHEYVERLGERIRNDDPKLLTCITLPEVIDNFALLNKLIHNLEGDLYAGNWITSSFGPPVGDPSLPITTLKYRMLAEATVGYKKNCVYLDYCETGKNMFHIYEQNDVETLQRKMVQPQRNIHPSIFINLEKDMKVDYEDYKKWCIDNNAEELGYDYENPRWWGTWELGTIVKSSFIKTTNIPYYDSITAKII